MAVFVDETQPFFANMQIRQREGGKFR